MTIIAFAASCADNGKSLPILLATSASPAMSLDVPPATIAALLSDASKSPKPLTAFTPIAVVATPAIVMPLPTSLSDPKILDPALLAFCVRPSSAEPAFCIVAKYPASAAFSTASTLKDLSAIYTSFLSPLLKPFSNLNQFLIDCRAL